MLAELIIGSCLYYADKSSKMDERALQKYAKAFQKSAEAERMVKQKSEYTDDRLLNVARKKRAIIEYTIPNFAEVYGKIQQIKMNGDFEVSEYKYRADIDEFSYLQKTDLSVKKSFTDKELVCGTLIYGVGKMWVKDSERYLSAASNQAKASNIEYSQAQTICAILDGIIARADRMAELLKSMNFLFRKSISHTADVIEKNGFNIRNYTQEEKGVLMTCANFALAVVDIINTPIYDESGKLAEAAIDAIECGENYINAVSEVINNY